MGDAALQRQVSCRQRPGGMAGDTDWMLLLMALSCCTDRCTAAAMVIGVRVDPELEQRLAAVAQQLGKSRSACIREAIDQYLLRHDNGEQARQQSLHLAQLESLHWSEQIPDWSDWTA